MSDSLVSVLTALGDDELILGHRHSEWTGFAPHIEEDVAFSSIAQDEIGHAAAYYSLVAKVTDDDPDRLALGREKDEYRNAILCERDNGDWAYTLARHWLYDHADAIRLESLEGSAHEELAALVTKIRREERYHLLHADTWLKRVSQGPVEGRKRLADSVAIALPEAGSLFEPFELEEEAVKEGWLPVPSGELRERFMAETAEKLDALGLPTEVSSHADERAEFVASSSGDLIAGEGEGQEAVSGDDASGGRRGKRTTDFDALWDDMTAMYRTNPGARW
ncbi:MAG TPA: 1,2-phenylacetyl-CoA epoxidase subunit PaaC [Actinomycetota bacterium]|nr:1,2-phenylacetyl-CoA epoxidase subunit PaaC [Actinomycetota bacterium]